MPKIRNSKSKWQEASNLVNKYRTDLADMLRSFTDEERQNIRYDDLINDIKSNACRAIRDVTPDRVGDCSDPDAALTDDINWKSKKLWVIILSSPVIVGVLPYIPAIFLYIKGLI